MSSSLRSRSRYGNDSLENGPHLQFPDFEVAKTLLIKSACPNRPSIAF